MSGIFAYRELLLELTLREIKQRYKQSILGYAWVILNPFFQMVVMAFVFSQILRFNDLGVPYPLFLYVGLLPWSFLANSLSTGVGSLVSNASLLTKIYFPREIFVQSTILAKAIDFFLASSIFVFFLIFYRISPTWNVLWFVPIFMLQSLFIYGVTLILSAFNLFYRDIQYLLSLIILVWMYLTPVIYPTDIFPEKYRWIFQLNPMAVFITTYRDVILYGQPPNLLNIGIAGVITVVLFLVSFSIFKKLEGGFADVV